MWRIAVCVPAAVNTTPFHVYGSWLTHTVWVSFTVYVGFTVITATWMLSLPQSLTAFAE
ncbi:MAG: hypothetical protein J6T62_12845 [Fibrobacter sp.]|nr:hypothetical protein [Fibrobacter sp.]